jgi:hypothetical protein
MRLYPLISVFTLAFGLTSAHAAAPVWTVRDIDQFQDNFASDGTLIGFVRADMANDILPDSSPGILPGDSSVVVVADPVNGLATDGVLGGKAVYCYVLVQPFAQPSKTGAALSGGSRWPLAGSEVIGGHTWTKLRLDQSDIGGGPVPDNFCIDLNDNLFTPGDTIFFFYSAKSADVPGSTSYFSLEFGTTTDITVAAALPMEFTCLPAGGFNRGGEMIYIDAADGTQSQIYWEAALNTLGVLNRTDRYDVRGPADGANNRPASRVVNIAGQFNAAYELIYWDSGPYSDTVGDGSSGTMKTDDYALFNVFLSNATPSHAGGILLFGDDVAEQLDASISPSALVFKQTFMPFELVGTDHSSLFGSAPTGVAWPGRCLPDNVLLYGVDTPSHDFDVVKAAGSSQLQMTYGPAAVTNGAVVSNRTINGNGANVGVTLNCFGLASVRDNDTDGLYDRARFLGREGRCTCGCGPFGFPVAVRDKPGTVLTQNQPNPFNPTTTIAYSLSVRAHVTITIFDVSGRRVRVLTDMIVPAGAHNVSWDGLDDTGRGVASGVYFYRLVAGDFRSTKKMVLLK